MTSTAEQRSEVPTHDTPRDPRVAAVLKVLGGAPYVDVAEAWSVEPDLLRRWVAAFVEAGTAQVLNRPEPQALAQRERFLAAFTFEIRNPLTVALGWAGLLAEGDLPTSSFLSTARRLQQSLALLADRLVDVELLVAAAVGGLTVQCRPVRASEVCQLPGLGVIGGAGPDAELNVDPVLFARILGDLWAAAATSPAPRSRRIEIEALEPWVEVRIVRDGDPIDTDTLQALFEPFEFDQLSSGVSIGLYLARALTIAHGGTIGIDQDSDGARLWVRVPAIHPPRPDPGSRRRRSTRRFKLACGDVLPGCSARFDDETHDGLLVQVAEHAAAEHGISEITPEVRSAVESRIVVG